MDNYTLKSVLDLPAPFRSMYSFRYFNSMQSECFSACYLSDINMVISAPTGSGKTALFELCILRVFSKFISTEGKFIQLKGTLKTIYIAPSKALVQEKLRDWIQKFGSWGINCLELTSDNEHYNMRNIQDADIILTTPEKFDAVTRYRIKDGGLSFFSDIALVLIDEVHLLNDPRGAALEAIVSRMKMLACKTEMKSSPLAHVRFLAISATIPNIDDLAEWLMAPNQGIKRFGEEMRPVKLTTKVLGVQLIPLQSIHAVTLTYEGHHASFHAFGVNNQRDCGIMLHFCYGYTPAKNDFLFEKRLQNYIFDILMQYSRGKSALVFCATRKGAQEAAQRLAQIAMTFGHSNPFTKSREQEERLREASLSCGDKQMQSYILYGVGYHNGGLSMKDRNLIEGLFLNGDLQVLCTTNTLALGINLPAHTVVIKSTQHFNKEKGIYMEYDRSMILQMCGRAGRPPFDDTGTVIIMTRKETVHLYENLLNGCEMVESQMLPCMTEHLTAEIVQLTISDITRAIEWMKCSYLYVRMKKNPEIYSVKKGLPGNRIEKHMQEICVRKINELSRYQMIWTDEDGFLLKPLEPGMLMTKYYLKFDTMKHIMLAPASCSIEDALHIICRAEEIAWIQLRRNDKRLLNDINIDKDGRLRFHILGDNGKVKKRVQTREEKIFILANDCLTGDPLVRDLSMSQDMNSICSNGCRIAKCMKEYFIHKKNYKGALNSTLLAKSLHQKLWDDSPYLLKQLPGIGMVTAKALHSMGVNSFKTFLDADPRKIEIVTGRKYPFGNHIKESLLSLPPKVEMKFEETVCQKQGKSKLMVTLTRLSESVLSNKRHYADMIVSIEDDNIILFHEKIRVDEFLSPYSATVLMPRPHQGKLTVNADLMFEEFLGIDIHQSLTVRKENDLHASYKHASKNTCTSQHNDVCIIEEVNDCPSQAPVGMPINSNGSKEQADNMPTFKLLDEDSEGGAPAFDTEDDDCKIITEKTVFDHIREKAKKFPALELSNDACSPSMETLTLIRKRTREQQLELDNSIQILDEKSKIKDNHQPLVILSAESVDLEPVCNRGPTPGKFLPVHEDFEPETLAEGCIFDHIRRKAKTFPLLGNLYSTEFKNMSNHGNLTFDGFEAYSRYQVLHDPVIIADPDAMDIRRNATTKGATEPEDIQSSGKSIDIDDKMVISPKATLNGKELRSNEEPAPSIPLVIKRKLMNPVSFRVSYQPQPSSSALLHGQCSSVENSVDFREENSFLGFKSVFSFL